MITGADEEPSVVMNEADMLSSPKRPPTLKRGRTGLSRKKTVTINDDTFMGPETRTALDPSSPGPRTELLTAEDLAAHGVDGDLSAGRGRPKSSSKLIRVQEESDADSPPGESQLY